MPQTIDRTLLITLIFLTALPLLSANMFLAALADIAREFNTDYSVITGALSAYLIFTAVIQIIAGPIADIYGRRPVLLFSLTLFVLASIGVIMAESFAAFLLFRVLQGAIATGMALSRTIVSDIVPTRKGASTLGYIAMAMSLAPILGPSIGGSLSEFAGWKSNFYLYSGLGTALWFLVWYKLPETGKKNPFTIGEFKRSYSELIFTLDFWMYTLVISLGIGAFFCFITGMPIIAGKQFNMSQSEIGLCIGSITCGFLAGSFLSGIIAQKYSFNVMIILGRLVACTGLIFSTFMLLFEPANPQSVLLGTALVGAGNGLTSPSANLAIMCIKEDLAASASGLAGATIVLVGALITAITGVILDIYPNSFALIAIMSSLTITSLIIASVQAFFRQKP